MENKQERFCEGCGESAGVLTESEWYRIGFLCGSCYIDENGSATTLSPAEYSYSLSCCNGSVYHD